MSPLPLLLFFCLMITACGRKNKNFFHFEEKKKVSKINKLTLPSIRSVSVESVDKKNKISWQRPDTTKHQLIGYNIYRFDYRAFIPRKPLTTLPTKQLTYDDATTKNYYYIVRPLFLVNNKKVEGPASRVAKKPSNLEQAGGLGGRTIP